MRLLFEKIKRLHKLQPIQARKSNTHSLSHTQTTQSLRAIIENRPVKHFCR